MPVDDDASALGNEGSHGAAQKPFIGGDCLRLVELEKNTKPQAGLFLRLVRAYEPDGLFLLDRLSGFRDAVEDNGVSSLHPVAEDRFSGAAFFRGSQRAVPSG